MRDKLTAMQESFAMAFGHPGSETRNNGRKSAKVAGAKGTDNAIDTTACRWLRLAKVKARIVEIEAKAQVKAGYGFEEAMAALDLRIGYLAKLAEGGNIQAITAQTVILKEKNEISGQHKQRFIDETEQTQQLKLMSEGEAKELAILRTRMMLKKGVG